MGQKLNKLARGHACFVFRFKRGHILPIVAYEITNEEQPRVDDTRGRVGLTAMSCRDCTYSTPWALVTPTARAA
eukprot:953456-Prorocentrum_minimum.AAC.1